VDEARLSERTKSSIQLSVASAAILLPAAFFLSVLPPAAQWANGLIYLAYVGAVILGAGVLTLGVGLIRRNQSPWTTTPRTNHKEGEKL
jgi:protein-S-isoprenylcysteine O-methyltransferase Ste14